MSARPRLLWDIILLGLITVTAFAGLAYGWRRWKPDNFKRPLPWWRRALATIGALAVSLQALLFLLFWTRIGRDPMLIAQWAKWVDPAFFVAVPCVLAGRGRFRWCLLPASVLLFVICFFFTLTA